MEVKRILLLGGEPLLHPELNAFLKITRELFPNSEIRLVSNGLLIKSQKDSFWQAMKNYDITMACTHYPINLDYDEIAKLCTSKGINYIKFGSKFDNNYWKHPLDITGNQNTSWNFVHCWIGNNCITLKNGKLYTCNPPAHVEHFNKYFNQNIKVTEQDYIDIYKVKDIQEVLSGLANPIPFCRYCNIKGWKLHEKWDLSKKDICEWT